MTSSRYSNVRPSKPAAVIVLEVEEPARAYVLADSDHDAARVLAWIGRHGAAEDVLDELRVLLWALREAA